MAQSGGNKQNIKIHSVAILIDPNQCGSQPASSFGTLAARSIKPNMKRVLRS
jgi:hypothetical protein